MRRFAFRAFVVLLALLALRFVIGWGLATIHYLSTAPFEEYVASHPVEASFAEDVFEGTIHAPLEETEQWGPLDPLALSTGEEEDPEFERGTRLIEIEITHGNQRMCLVRQKVHAALARHDHSYHGLAIEPPEVVTHPEMRAVIAVRMREAEGELGVDRKLGGRLQFDCFLLSGKGAPDVRIVTGEDDINIIGYCIGGTLLACALAYLTATGQDDKVNKATFFTTMTDFSEPGELGNFLEPGFLRGITKQVEEVGYLESYFMSRAFSFLRSKDLVYAPAVRNYMMGEKPPAFDLLQWNGDSTNLPGRMAIEYLEKLYVNNELADGEFVLMGERLRLAQIKVPIYVISTIQDHIAPWKSTFKGLAKVRGERTFILSESGHIAGIVNPASRDKYGHWTNAEPPRDPDFWFENATFEKKSWWHGWADWVAEGQKQATKARQPGSKAYPILEAAPGTYVQRK